jgi:hypothetical protein
MALQVLANQIRGAREKWAVLVAEALVEIERAILGLTTSIGFTSDLSGIKKKTLLTENLIILMPNGNTIAVRLSADSGVAVMDLQAAGSMRFSASNLPSVVQVSPGTIQINASPPFFQNMVTLQGFRYDNGDFTGGLSVLGGVTAGTLATFGIDATKAYFDALATFVDPVDGDSVFQAHLNAAGGCVVDMKKGADNAISATVDNVIVTFTVKNVTHTTTVKPESVSTSRLGVGVSPPATDGHANVATYLGAAAATPSSGEKLRVGGNARVDSNLGIGMNPARALDVTGNGKFTGTLEVDGAAQFDTSVTITPLAAGDLLIGQVAGTLSTVSASTARFFLDVYTKAEVDAAIAAAIAAIVVDNALVGTPEEHNHSLS